MSTPPDYLLSSLVLTTSYPPYYLLSAYLRPGALQLRLVAAPVVDHVVRKLLEARLRPVTRMVTGWAHMVAGSNTYGCRLCED